LAVSLCALLAFAPAAAALPDASPAAFQAIGRIGALDPGAGHITVATDAGTTLLVSLGPGTALLRLVPGQTSLQGATPTTPAELVVGDRVLVRGGTLREGRLEQPRQVLVMARADLAAQEEQQQRAWRERGLSGTVSEVDVARNQVLLRPAGLRLRAPVTVDLARARLRRYAEQSARFADARAATLAEVRAGDQMRVLGQRDPDGARYVAEQAVFGSFRSLAASIESVDLGARSLVVKDLESQARHLLVLAPDARLRRLTPELAALSHAAPAGGRAPDARPAARETGAGQRGGGAGRAPDELTERLPALQLEELRKGDWVGAVVAPRDADGRTLTFHVLAGIEALATRSEAAGAPVQVGLPAGLLDSALGVQ
jgi:hypothetical protein